MIPDPPLPGQTPLDDISGLKPRNIRTQAQLNSAEAENIRRAVVKYLAARPPVRLARFDTPWSLRLHKEMFGRVWAWAGTLRTGELNIGSSAHRIGIDLHNLFEDLLAWEGTEMSLLEQAVRLHHAAVRIHPFRNGNGRWARMLGNIWLKRHGGAPTRWPEVTIGTDSPVRGEYLDAIRAADRGDLRDLILLHERFAG